MFNTEELTNIYSLINIAPITGKDSEVVAMLKHKITKLINTPEEKPQKETATENTGTKDDKTLEI